jgi:hypothetical protein
MWKAHDALNRFLKPRLTAGHAPHRHDLAHHFPRGGPTAFRADFAPELKIEFAPRFASTGQARHDDSLLCHDASIAEKVERLPLCI